MEQFNIRKGGFKEIRKEVLIYIISIMLIVAFGGIAITYFSSSGQESEVNVYPFVIPIILFVLGFGIYRSISRQKEIFESYKLTIDNDTIIREQYNTQTITIAIADISEICKNSNGSFTIKGSSAINVINIPAQIDNYEKIEQLLSEIKLISYKNRKTYLQMLFAGLLSILIIGLMVVVYIIKDKIIVGICGTILLVILGFSILISQRNKNIDSKTKKGMWLSILVIASIIGVMFYKIFR